MTEPEKVSLKFLQSCLDLRIAPATIGEKLVMEHQVSSKNLPSRTFKITIERVS